MIKALIKNLFRVAGFQLVRIPGQPARTLPARQTSTRDSMSDFVYKITNDPLNADLHLQYAVQLSKVGRSYLAYAELKTAEYLGADREEIEKRIKTFRDALPRTEDMSHNRYYRLISLSSEIVNKSKQTELSVLDVGGGQGELASFIPGTMYCLAEPSVNGISGIDLPFPDRSFDYVVSCHVLEHIPENNRRLFLDQLLSKSKRGVFLLNPFYVEGTYADDSLKLVMDVSGLQWAKEHLEYGLPRVENIEAYANQRGLQLSVKPNGTWTTTMAYVFLETFARKSESREELKKIDRFFNEKYRDILDSADFPNALLVYLGWPEPEVRLST